MFENTVENLFICSLFWQNCNFAIVLHSWWKLGWTLYTVYCFSAECQGLWSIWVCVLQCFVSSTFPEFDFVPVLNSWDGVGGKRPEEDASLAVCWVERGSSFGWQPVKERNFMLKWTCLLQMCLPFNAREGAVAQGLEMCMAKFGAGFTLETLTQLEVHCVVVFWSARY